MVWDEGQTPPPLQALCILPLRPGLFNGLRKSLLYYWGHFVCREIPDAARKSQHAALLEKEHLVSFSTVGLIL